MADVSLLIVLAVVIISGIVVFRIVSSILKTFLIVAAFGAIVIAIAGGFVVKDAFDYKSGLEKGDKLMLFSAVSPETGKEVITSGLVITGKAKASGTEALAGLGSFIGEGSRFLSDAELGRINEAFVIGDLKAVKADNYMFIVFREQPIIDAMPESPDARFGGQNFTRGTAPAVLQGKLGGQRAMLLSLFLMTAHGDNPLELFLGFKNGDIYVYPETLALKAARRLPLQLLEPIAKRVLGSGVVKPLS